MSEPINESILDSIRKLIGAECGVEDDPTDSAAFDVDLIVQINTAFSILHRLGVGPEEGFSISDSSTTWNEFIDLSSKKQFNNVKTYIFLKVQLYFDPPTNSALLELKKEQISELEWTLNVEASEESEE